VQQISAPPEAAVAARFVLTLWRLQFGDKEGARKAAEEAAQLSKTPQTAAMAALARFMSAPPSKEGPSVSGRGADTLRRQLMGYSLLLNGNFADAAGVWTELYKNASVLTGNDERILLAWAQAERGNLPETAKLMRSFALPPNAVDPALQLLLFPRAIFVKALSEQQANNTKEAKRLFKLFLDYSADRDFAYGEEKRARELLAKP
jgi:hypothetical protein